MTPGRWFVVLKTRAPTRGANASNEFSPLLVGCYALTAEKSVFYYRFRPRVAMPRQAKNPLEKGGRVTYWHTEAGGPTYFGNLEAAPYQEVGRLFAAHAQILLVERNVRKEKGFTE